MIEGNRKYCDDDLYINIIKRIYIYMYVWISNGCLHWVFFDFLVCIFLPVWLCYKHVQNPRQREGIPSPYSIVTALVDRIDFNQGAALRPDKDIRLSGHVSWAGRSSMETVIRVEQYVEGSWQQVWKPTEFLHIIFEPVYQYSFIAIYTSLIS